MLTPYCTLSLLFNAAEYVGKQGGVEAVVAGMRACPDSYQVQTSGTRCLQNLVAATDANRVRAKAAGATEMLSSALEANPEDGQLQWRGQQLLVRLNSLSEDDMKRYNAATEVARSSPWSRLRSAVFSGHAKKISHGNAPGLYGASAVVAKYAQQGLAEVVRFMKQRVGYHEIETWCCDAISTMINGNGECGSVALCCCSACRLCALSTPAHAPHSLTPAFPSSLSRFFFAEENAKLAVSEGAIDAIVTAMKGGIWEDELQLKALWALLALAPTHSVQIGDADAISILVSIMYANKTNHQIQVAAVKLLSLLTIETSGKNLERARELKAARIVKSTIAAHTEDGTLQYRGVNLLERLEPGITLSMPKQSMIRSYSMRAEEMVSSYRLSARSFLTASQADLLSRTSGGSTAPSRADTEKMKQSVAAIHEVDEMAEAVEEHDNEEQHEQEGKRSESHSGGDGSGGSGGGGGAGDAKAEEEDPSKLPGTANVES
jgi:hypothetical protein